MSLEPAFSALHQALAQLTPLERNLLQLRYVHGMSVSALSEVLDVPARTIERRIASARRRTLLHARLAESGDGPMARLGDLTRVLQCYPCGRRTSLEPQLSG